MLTWGDPPCLFTPAPVPTTMAPANTDITIGGCTQVVLSEWVTLLWTGLNGNSFSASGSGATQSGALQNAIANFETGNPSCLTATTTPAPAVPITSPSSFSIGGCTQVSIVNQWIILDWNGYRASGSGANALQQAIVNFESSDPPCLIATAAPLFV
eukprot:GDKK01040096.1.p1 GENE.GDKK01040096.1~~GDKK01040096.1.p1  ORF type:complete len:156 (+),score=3.52 GDKK01040096.1:1-468(+)